MLPCHRFALYDLVLHPIERVYTIIYNGLYFSLDGIDVQNIRG